MSLALALPRLRRLERQIIVSCDGVVRSVVMIPDYQVKVHPGRPWCRRGGIEGETACGCKIDNTHALRAYVFDSDLCKDGCFSPHEIRLGVAAGIPRSASRFDLSDSEG